MGFIVYVPYTRTVKLEMVPSLCTSSFILGVVRFIARRGTPTTIMSDNDTIVFGAQKQLLACVES